MYQEIVQLITVGTMRSPGYASNFQIVSAFFLSPLNDFNSTKNKKKYYYYF